MSDLVASVLERLPGRLIEPFGLAKVPHPAKLPNVAINGFWHAKYHRARSTAGCAARSSNCSPSRSRGRAEVDEVRQRFRKVGDRCLAPARPKNPLPFVI